MNEKSKKEREISKGIANTEKMRDRDRVEDEGNTDRERKEE